MKSGQLPARFFCRAREGMFEEKEFIKLRGLFPNSSCRFAIFKRGIINIIRIKFYSIASFFEVQPTFTLPIAIGISNSCLILRNALGHWFK